MAERTSAAAHGRRSAGLGWAAAHLHRLRAALSEIVRGAAGLQSYEQYVAHVRSHHPHETVPTREEFYRGELTARWQGIRRCC